MEGEGTSAPETAQGEPLKLSAYQLRKQRERAKEAAREARRLKREGKVAGKGEGEELAPSAAAEAVEEINEAALERQIATFLPLVWWGMGLVARIFGRVPGELVDVERHAANWLPIAVEHRWLRRIVKLTAPWIFFQDFVTSLRPKGDVAPKKERAA